MKKNVIVNGIAVIISIGMLQSLFMFPFWLFWNNLITNMISGTSQITPIQAWLFLCGFNVFKFYMIETHHVEQCIKEEHTEESDEEIQD